jgi:hypothetical protein
LGILGGLVGVLEILHHSWDNSSEVLGLACDYYKLFYLIKINSGLQRSEEGID